MDRLDKKTTLQEGSHALRESLLVNKLGKDSQVQAGLFVALPVGMESLLFVNTHQN
jgi:hypothetical protein